MGAFLLHAVECFFWCGVWHYVHHMYHRWTQSGREHFQLKARTRLSEALATPHESTDVRHARIAKSMFRNGGMKL